MGLSSKDVGAGDAAHFTDVIDAALAALESNARMSSDIRWAER